MNASLLGLFSGFPTHHFTDEIAQVLRENLPRRESLVFISAWPEDYARNDDDSDGMHEMFAERGMAFAEYHVLDRRTNAVDAVRLVQEADCVFLMGGDATLQMALIHELGLVAGLRACQAVILGVSAGSMNMGRYVADVWETKALYEGIGLTDFTVKGHYVEDAWFVPALKEMSMTLPIVAMEDESAIFIKANAVWKLGNLHWIVDGEIRDGYSPDTVDMSGDSAAMERATRKYLAKVAGEAAQIPFHGCIEGKESNLEPIIRFFPKWTPREADGLWCAAFVYYCCREAGFEIPVRPDECKTCHLAGCIAWEEFAAGDPRITYHKFSEGFEPEAGDIVLYDRVFENREHDHIGIVIENREKTMVVAEGNIGNRSGIIERPKDAHIRGYIRIPDGYRYRRMIMDYQTESLILHFATEGDVSEVARSWPADHHPLYDAEAREAIAYMRGNYERNTKGRVCHLCLAVCGKEHPETIMGWCGLDGSRNPAEPEIFILLDEAYRNRGYGTQCVKELLRIAVEDYSLSGVHGGCAKENIASARAMEKGGMVRYGAEENGDPLFRFTAKEKSWQ